MMMKVPLEKFKLYKRVKQREKKIETITHFRINSVVFTF